MDMVLPLWVLLSMPGRGRQLTQSKQNNFKRTMNDRKAAEQNHRKERKRNGSCLGFFIWPSFPTGKSSLAS